jgi:hypothetical protein
MGNLIIAVNKTTMDPTNKNALIVKLQQAVAKLSAANGGPVCGPLKSFINQLAVSPARASATDANYLMAQANPIRAFLGCP